MHVEIRIIGGLCQLLWLTCAVLRENPRLALEREE
jgi:hypothetical protein